MKNSKFKVQSSKLVIRKVAAFLLLLITAYCLVLTAFAHEGEDHSKDKPQTTTIAATEKSAVTIARAERNVQTDNGQFNVRLERVPADVRNGETAQFAVRIAEKVEGGFGGGEPLPIENANVSADITTADGQIVSSNVPLKIENGFYRGSYNFSSDGNFKIVFNAVTSDKRKVSVDFPLSVVNAPVNWTFWLILSIFSLLLVGVVGAVIYATRGYNGNAGLRAKKVVPVAVAAILIFVLGTFSLAYFAPPRQTRNLAEMPKLGTNAGATETEIANSLSTSLIVPKESQLLFGIKTEPVETRTITAGLKTTGTVKARPDAKAVVVPPTAGKVIFREGLSLGSVVGRGDRIGYVEQILDVSGQTGLESQRLEVEAQQREIEVKRMEIKNSVLQLQSQQVGLRSNAEQAKTRLAQAQRELRRAENLVEVGAVPKKRFEEANTAVRIAEQEIASIEKQIALLDNQIEQVKSGENIFRDPSVKQPRRRFPLTAPVTGTISEIKATSGQQVEAGTELLSIVNLTVILIEAQVFERDLPAVRESTRASFTNPALNNEIYTIGTSDGDGRLISIGQTVNPETRTVPVIYEMKNPLNRLRDGMFVEITIDTSGNRQVLAVPKQAVVTDQGQTFVFVFDGGETFEKRAIVLGAEGADYYEIGSGLKQGERVVVEGVYQLRSTQGK